MSWSFAAAIVVLFVLGLGVLGLGRFGFTGFVVKAAARMLAQLALVGVVLTGVFELQSLGVTLAYLMFMTIAAAYITGERQKERYPRFFIDACLALTVGVWTTTGLGLALWLGPRAVLDPRQVIPLFGIACGNMINGFTIGCREFAEVSHGHLPMVELRLSLGAEPWEAIKPHFRTALDKALLPITNAMLAAGVVSLPGALVGQLAAGADPFTASLYQMLILATIFAATALGTSFMLYLNFRRLARRFLW